MARPEVIFIHPEAPPKPTLGAPCNGCGVCCLAEPCPVGIAVSGRVKGACKALVWSDDAGRYHCGVLLRFAQSPGSARSWWQRWPRAALERWARRMIAAGSGCDASMEVAQADSPRARGGQDAVSIERPGESREEPGK